MTKKDYVLIAEAIKKAHQALMYATVCSEETNRAIEITAQILSNELKKENPKFNQYMFLGACGVTE